MFLCGCAQSGSSSVSVSSQSEVQYTPSGSINGELEDSAKTFLYEFFDTVYLYMSTWEDTNLTEYFDDTGGAQALICQNAFELLTDIRQLRHNDLHMEQTEYYIDILEVTPTDTGYELYFTEGYDCVFAFNDTLSQTRGILSWMGLSKGEDSWNITYYDREEDFYYLILNRVDIESDTPMQEQISAVRQTLMESFNENMQFPEADNSVTECDNPYDREAAADYAEQYALSRNPDWYSYDDWGGNCQNLASQAMLTGGIPMDISGEDIWKHFDEEADFTANEVGHTFSWTAVNYFYSYAANNTGYGLCCSTDKNIYTAQKGDIVQMGSAPESYAHTVVATDILTDENGQVTDIVTASNTVDRKNYPLSAYNYPLLRLIQIYGWNNA